jgi:hypothetical protein
VAVREAFSDERKGVVVEKAVGKGDNEGVLGN